MADQPLPAATAPSTRPAVLSLAIKEESALYAAYIPFFTNGGIFVPTNKPYQIGDDIYLILSLMDDPTKYPIAGKIAWITPFNAHFGKPQGIGVHFPSDDSGIRVRLRIEGFLGAAAGSTLSTHTL